MTDWLPVLIPIFVAIDPIGLLPIFVGLTQDLDHKAKRKIIVESMFTALVLAIGFIFLGRYVFHLLGITLGDFMVAGGLILLGLALTDLLYSGKQRYVPAEDLGAVPLGTPLMVGPAVLASSIIMVDQHGISATVISIVVNILFVGVIFVFSKQLIRVFGESGARALSKVMALLLGAIAVMLIRKGIGELF